MGPQSEGVRRMRIAKYLKNHKLAVVLIVALLIVQAFADLSLPTCTSNVVNVGIQQYGVEDASPTEMRGSTFDYLCMLATEDDEQLIRQSYDQSDTGTWVLNDYGSSHRDALDEAVKLPIVVVSFAENPDSDEISTDTLDQMLAAYTSGALGKQDIETALEQAVSGSSMLASLSDDSLSSLLDQQAIQGAINEYRALGYDLSSIQLGYLFRIAMVMLGITLLMVAASVSVGFLVSRTAAKVAHDLRQRLFDHVVGFSDAEVHRFSAASLITRTTNDVQQIQMVTMMTLRMVLYAPIVAIGGVIMISRINLSMSWVIGVAIVVIAVVLAVVMAVVMPKFRIMQKLIDRVNQVAREMLSGILVVRAFGRQQYEEQRFDEASRKLRDTQLFTNRAMAFLQPTIMFVMNAISVLIVWVGGSAIDAGAIRTGDLIAFINYAMVIIASFMIVGMVFIFLPRADVAAQRVDEVLACAPSVTDPEPTRRAVAEDAPVPTLAKDGGAVIAFNDVTFSYRDDAEPVLEHITFTAQPGQTLAIVGSTGSGKSTIVRLIERFYDVTEGSITVDGVDVRDMPQAYLRAQLGYVPQKAFLFSGTVGDTIAYGREGLSQEKAMQAAEVAQAAGFIKERPEGLDTVVNQGGTNVSGGQRQRLAIARAVALEARAYLFDDAFSALDYKTDAELRRALDESLGAATKIIVAQRVATVMDADQIVVLEEGRMVGLGTHAELLESCPAYREIASSQLSAAELERGRA